MKKRRQSIARIGAILFGVILGLCTFQEKTALAAESKQGAITIQLSDLGTSMEGVEFTLYKVEGTTKESVVTAKTDAQGSLTFSNLEEGEYEVVQSNTATYGKVLSFVVTLPYEIEGTVANKVTAKPKGELFREETEENKSVPTGDNSSVILYMVLASATLLWCGIIAFYKKRKNALNAILVVFLVTTLVSGAVLPVAAAEENSSSTSVVPEWATNRRK